MHHAIEFRTEWLINCLITVSSALKNVKRAEISASFVKKAGSKRLDAGESAATMLLLWNNEVVHDRAR